MPELIAEIDRLSLLIEIGRVPIRVNTSDPDFLSMLQNRYSGFVPAAGHCVQAEIEFDIELAQAGFRNAEADVRVTQRSGRWRMERGDFRAEWNPASRRGSIRQSANPYSI